MIDTRPILLPVYKRLDVPSHKRYVIATGGRGGGKSFHVADFIRNLTYNTGEVILYTRYTMISAEISIIPEFEEKIDMYGTRHHFIIKKKEIVNRLTGSKILFRGIKTSQGNQTANLKSIQGVTAWVVDEAEEMVNEADFDKIDNSIRSVLTQNRVILMMNPCEKEHWIYKKWFAHGELEDTEYIHTTYLDNLNNLSESFLRKAEKTRLSDKDKYDRVYLGKWGSSDDLIFPKWDTYNENITSYDWKLYGGDFGYSNDPCAYVEVICNRNHLYIRQLIHKTQLSNNDLANLIKEGGWNDKLSIWDSADGGQRVNELRLLNINAVKSVKGPGSVVNGIEKMNEYKLFIHEDSKQLQEELEKWKWQKKANGEYARDTEFRKIPIKGSDHLLDAARYATTKFTRVIND